MTPSTPFCLQGCPWGQLPAPRSSLASRLAADPTVVKDRETRRPPPLRGQQTGRGWAPAAPAGLSEAAPPTRHNLHWGQRRGPRVRQRVGVGAGRVTGPSEAAASAAVRGGGHGAAAVSRAVSVGEGVGRGPADINIPGGQARPVICPDLEHDVRSQGTGARPAPTVSPTGEALGVGAHLGAGWPSGLGAPVPVERPAAPTLPTPRDVDDSGGALGKATLASTTTPAPGRSPNNTWPRRTGGTASQGQVSGQIGPGLPRNPGCPGAGPRPTQTLEAGGGGRGSDVPRAKVRSGNSRWRSRSHPLLPVKSDPLRTPWRKPAGAILV